jgi:outer membrane protein OmpA-like peptidoglycan-associated protein
MKTILLFTLITFISFSLSAQVKVDVENKVNREANQRANSRTDQAIDKGFDKLEEGINSLFKKKEKKRKADNVATEEQVQQNNNAEQPSNRTSEEQGNGATTNKPDVVWSRFDFVPGDEVIFEDAPIADEENGEFPSRWDLLEGNCEIIEVNGEKVIAFPKGGIIVPYLKNSKDDYLPEIFTIEFDAWLWNDNQRDIYVHFYDKKNQKNSARTPLQVNSFSLEFGDTYQKLEEKTLHNGKWRHISIAYTKGKLKAYLDDTRLINIPHYEGNPSGLTIECNGYSGDTPEQLQYIKNIRIAKGGVKYYDRVLSEGKIIVNGIKFDVNKATLRPESMGPINGIYELMQKNPGLNFSVEGHTDSDGENQLNQELSEERAKAVVDRLISMGISSNRLKSTGWGESKPIGKNDTAEGKAQNRRVEFVKF